MRATRPGRRLKVLAAPADNAGMDTIRILIALIESPLTWAPERAKLRAELQAAYLERLAEAQAEATDAVRERA